LVSPPRSIFDLVHTGLVGGDVIIRAMSLSLVEVEHIADLARLELSEKEKERFREQLSAILEYAARLRELDTSGIPPTSSLLPEGNVLRPDQSRPSLPLETLLLNAPQVQDGQFRVPVILDPDQAG
jgi:aspartyl-tRNA(Asn)/glutamyl-tRNA(Gln) amidotransferase subunit C